jgi:hypothetical protein
MGTPCNTADNCDIMFVITICFHFLSMIYYYYFEKVGFKKRKEKIMIIAVVGIKNITCNVKFFIVLL